MQYTKKTRSILMIGAWQVVMCMSNGTLRALLFIFIVTSCYPAITFSLLRFLMDVKIKTFRIESPSDEQALNEFLAGKIVRHWGTSYEHNNGSGIWNVMIAYELRMNEPK